MTKIALTIASILLCACVLLGVQAHKQRNAAERYRANTETLLSEVERYRVRDSLSAARVQSLELTVKEFERFRAEDAELIRQLKRRNRDLQAVSDAQTETIIRLMAEVRDTVIITRDSIRVPAVAFHCGDAWYDFDGLLAEGQFTGVLKNRDSILLAETVKYKRFLFWKTRKIKDRELNVVSRNPHTEILGVEHIIIEK